ncbi:unnamed protein product, partial [Prorocentrum cordatum]
GDRSDDYLTPRHHRSVAQAALDGILNAQACGIPCYSDALHWISQATSAEKARLQDGANRQWRQRFATWSNDLWSYTTPMFKATPPTPAMNVHDMRQQLHDQRCPDNCDGDAHHKRWKTYAADTVFPKSDKGCPGLDGWNCKELRALAHWFPAIVRELFDLWTVTSTAAVQAKGHLPPDLLSRAFPWKVAGVPEGKSDARPISVGSVLLRVWLRSPSQAVPEPPDNQRANRSGTSVTHAIAAWLSDCADSSDGGGNIPVTGLRQHRSRAIPRRPHPERPARPRGLHLPTHSGDAMAPATMVACLAPWQPLSSGHAFMDDRAIVSTSPDALAIDIADTQSFDRRVGFVENIGKRQQWSDQDVVPRRIEHLGVHATPTDSSFGIIPRQ